jgi:hypothetical protein
MERDRENEELLTNYLLGSLPEAELERLERSYLEDEALLDELQEIEDELIDDYVSGALEADQKTRFEKYFLLSPSRREKLDFARALTEHAVAWRSESQTAQSSSIQRGGVEIDEKEGIAKVLPFKRWSRPVPVWRQWAAVAAAILIAVVVGALWFRNRELRREVIAAEAAVARLRDQANAESARTVEASNQLTAEKERAGALEEQMRRVEETLAQLQAARKAAVSVFMGLQYLVRDTRGGEFKVKTVVVPANTQMLKVGVEFEKSKSEKFRAILKRGDTTVWTSGVVNGHARGEGQAVRLNIPATAISAGQYDLKIYDAGQGEAVAHYILKVIRQ